MNNKKINHDKETYVNKYGMSTNEYNCSDLKSYVEEVMDSLDQFFKLTESYDYDTSTLGQKIMLGVKERLENLFDLIMEKIGRIDIVFEQRHHYDFDILSIKFKPAQERE